MEPVNKSFFVLLTLIVLSGCGASGTNKLDSSYRVPVAPPSMGYEDNGYDNGYRWAEDENIDSFDDCQSEFGTGDAEDGCNEYVKENYSGYQTFHGYECTEDCSGHEAGYEWAEENGVDDSYDCDGNSQSFNEGCESYVEENY